MSRGGIEREEEKRKQRVEVIISNEDWKRKGGGTVYGLRSNTSDDTLDRGLPQKKPWAVGGPGCPL